MFWWVTLNVNIKFVNRKTPHGTFNSIKRGFIGKGNGCLHCQRKLERKTTESTLTQSAKQGENTSPILLQCPSQDFDSLEPWPVLRLVWHGGLELLSLDAHLSSGWPLLDPLAGQIITNIAACSMELWCFGEQRYKGIRGAPHRACQCQYKGVWYPIL